MPDRSKAPAISEPSAYEIALRPLERFDLKNGVPLYYVNGGPEPVMKIDWIFNAGTAYEKQTAVATSVANLIRNGTSRMSSFEISQFFEYYGAYLNSTCFAEYSVFTLSTLSKYVKDLLPVVRELFTEAIFPEHELQIYSQNSIQRMRVNLEKCEYVADREIASLLFGKKNPYGRKTEISDLENLSRDKLTSFYKENYLTGNCKIFAAGQLPDEMTTLMDNFFGDLNIGDKRPVPEIARALAEPGKTRLTVDANGVQAAIRIARPFPGRHHPDFQKGLVLNTVFGGYFGSRLLSNIREDKGYTYGIYSYLNNNYSYSSWMIATEAGTEVAEATISEVYHEMKRLTEEDVPEEELKLVRNYLIGHQLASLDGPFNIIGRWKALILNDLKEEFFYDTIRTVKTVTPADLREVAQRYLLPESFYELAVV